MVKDDLDLTVEFEKIPYECDFIILTTFNFDPIFFDSFLLPKISDKHPDAEIVVLVDSGQYSNAERRFTSKTGTAYHLVPASLPRGVFHPKLHLFLSKVSNLATFYISSFNLTSAGITNNAELITKTEYNLESRVVGKNLIAFIKILQEINSKKNRLIKDRRVSEITSEINDYFKDHTIIDEKKIFLHNIEEPILDQTLALLRNSNFDEIVVFAPFLSPNPNVLDKIFSFTKPLKFVLKIQEKITVLENYLDYKEICDRNNIIFDIQSIRFIDDNSKSRRIHAKYIYFKGQNSFFLTGSPNFTESALLKTIKDGNFEAAILHEGEFDSFNNMLEPEPSGTIILNPVAFRTEFDKPKELLVYSIDFLVKENKILINTEEINKNIFVEIIDKNKKMFYMGEFSMEFGEIIIPLTNLIPFEVIIRDNNTCVKRRVFYDENYLIKEFSRSKITFNDIVMWAYKNKRTDYNTLLSISRIIMNKASNIRDIPTNKKSNQNGKSTYVKHPSMRTNNIIKKIKSLIETKTDLRQQFKLQEISIEDAEEGEDDLEISSEFEKLFEYEEEDIALRKYFKRLNTSFKKNSWNKDNIAELVLREFLLIESYLEFTNYVSLSRETDNEFLTYLMKNLEGIRENDALSEEYQKMLADVLVRFCYRRKQLLSHEAFNALNNFFRFTVLVDSKLFYEILDKIEEPKIDNSLFCEIFASLAIWSTRSERTTECIKFVILQMKQSDTRYEEFFLKFIHGLKEIRHVSHDSMIEGIKFYDPSKYPELSKNIELLFNSS